MNKVNIVNSIIEGLKIECEEVYINSNETVVSAVSRIVTEYVRHNFNRFDLNKTTEEGESKRIFKDVGSDICLISLKPTMYSFTQNRYGIVNNIDIPRNKLWRLFSNEINNECFSVCFTGNGTYSKKVNDLICSLWETRKISENYPFLTSYLGSIEIDGITYNICKYIENQTPLEFVWKKCFIGTMKHNLVDVDKFQTKYGTYIKPEDETEEFVRFDWRNPFEKDGVRYKDECIPDDFAGFWVDTTAAKKTVLAVSNIISEFLLKKDYIFVDTCYFINTKGSVVYSEITPDGMRIKKKGKCFDKDLWRIGKEESLIYDTWMGLYDDLANIGGEQ
ncbi:hypothetical protein [Anaeromicropila populeti]|uniref:Uncharacterized protein n=1 Tax=Anaeromicropila populeti TaxID=37658 RepID=A0A1I6INS2_9FIRM|nr:hypothetical protein [Anaeromicropila populeti]SFR68301.1 hypothetical protein SAMN05661086_00947 [Anaeromicropila populeti]